MMSQPSRGVHVPTDGLTGWGEAARRVGEGISAALAGGAQLLQERARVTAAGELAEFSERLQAIDRETREELAGREVQDWNYAWQAATAPKLAEAIDELSPDSRRAGQELAQAFSARASVEAQRDYELGKIDKARASWRSQVDRAVEEGNPAEARQWLDAGQGIFVPEQKMQAAHENVQSRATLTHWQKSLKQDPLASLRRLAAAPEEQLPRQQADARRLEQAKGQARRSARREVLGALENCLQESAAPEPDYVQLAKEAGILTARQAENALQEKPAKLSYAARRSWMRRIDECPDDDDAAEELKLDIATAPLPAGERRSLLKRVELSRSVPEPQRLRLSRSLRELYHSGVLGCPEDEEAQQFFAELQRDGLQQLAQKGAEETTQWLNNMRNLADRWVCFDA